MGWHYTTSLQSVPARRYQHEDCCRARRKRWLVRRTTTETGRYKRQHSSTDKHGHSSSFVTCVLNCGDKLPWSQWVLTDFPYSMHSAGPLPTLSFMFSGALASSCLSVRRSVCPTAWNKAPTGRIFIKFNIWIFFHKYVEKIKVSLKSEKKNGYFTWRLINIFIKCLSSS